jgi:hypothetical protein
MIAITRADDPHCDPPNSEPGGTGSGRPGIKGEDAHVRQGLGRIGPSQEVRRAWATIPRSGQDFTSVMWLSAKCLGPKP